MSDPHFHYYLILALLWQVSFLIHCNEWNLTDRPRGEFKPSYLYNPVIRLEPSTIITIRLSGHPNHSLTELPQELHGFFFEVN